MSLDLAIVGLQYGDEGKGRVVDALATSLDDAVVVRYSGGPNAGHTVVVGNERLIFHSIPCGLLSGQQAVISGECVVSLQGILQEYSNLSDRVRLDRLVISPRAHVILPYHILQDRAEEHWRGKVEDQTAPLKRLGTTSRGIGPCYQDKVGRFGLRVEDIVSDRLTRSDIEAIIERKRRLLEYVYEYRISSSDNELMNPSLILQLMERFRQTFRDCVRDDIEFISRSRRRGAKIIFEGAQAFAIDISHGRYPFVSSSNNIAGAAHISGSADQYVMGVTKCYSIAVGEGCFPSEIFGKLAERIRVAGREIGSTTGRERRIGWLDLPLLRRAVEINRVRGLCLTNVDVLAGHSEVGVCVSHVVGGVTNRSLDGNGLNWQSSKPQIVMLRGWQDVFARSSQNPDWSTIDPNLANFVAFLEKETGVPIIFMSYSPEREAYLARGPFKEITS